MTKKNPLRSSSSHQKEVGKILADMTRGGRHRMWGLFRDFLAAHALLMNIAADPSQRVERKAQYLDVIKRYTDEELEQFSRAFQHVVDGLEEDPFQDFLGSLFMSLELGNEWAGQFFTPYEIAYLMAGINFDADTLRSQIEAKGFVTVNDMCTGGGALLIAAANAIADAGFNYQQCMHVVAQDVDLTAVHMSYLQLSLLNVPGVVIHGNSLMVEERSHWKTLAHARGGWGHRLARALKAQQAEEEVAGTMDPAQAGGEGEPEPVDELPIKREGDRA